MTSNPPTILAIESASPACSAALLYAGQVYQRNQLGNNIHSQLLLEMVGELFAEAGIGADQLDAVAVGQGPGSFTGLRIGIGVAQGIAYGVGCPMLGVSSLAALALEAVGDGTVLAGLDARMGEIYGAEFIKTRDRLEITRDAFVRAPGAISSSAEAPMLVGNGWVEYRHELSDELLADAQFEQAVSHPSAVKVLTLAEVQWLAGETISPLQFQPVYVRDNVARKPARVTPD